MQRLVKTFFINIHPIAQDHRHVKCSFVKSAGFQSLRHASRTMKEIEIVYVLYKIPPFLKIIYFTY